MKPKFSSKPFSSNYLLLTFFVLLSSPTLAFALDFSKPIAGDSRCGGVVNGIAAPCSILDIFPQLKDMFLIAIVIIAFFAIVAFIWVGVKGLVAKDQAAALASTSKQAWIILLNIVIAVVLLGGLIKAFLKAFLKPAYYDFISKPFSRIDDTSIFNLPHAYAATSAQAANNLNPLVVNSVYDVAILLFQLAMRWILIPVLIGSWVWAGFLFIQAQGNPERINYARQRLWYSFVWTIILMLVLGLAIAFRNTFNQIFP